MALSVYFNFLFYFTTMFIYFLWALHPGSHPGRSGYMLFFYSQIPITVKGNDAAPELACFPIG